MPSRFLFLVAALAAALSAQDDVGRGAAASKGVLCVRVGQAWLGPQTVMKDAWLVVEDGVLKRLEPAAGFTPPEGAETIDLQDGWALPTFVHAHATWLGDASDTVAAVTPDVVAADAFDPFLPRKDYMELGVARAFISTGYARLVPGQGSIVRINAENPANATVLRNAALRIVFREGVRETPSIWKPPLLPSPEDPLPPAEVQGPFTRGGAAAQTRALFKAAAELRKSPRPRGDGEIDLAPFVAALGGVLRVRIAADRAADISAAVQIAREFGVKLVIEGGNEAWRVAGELAEVKASVVLRLANAAPIGPDSAAPIFLPEDAGHPDAPSILKRAGVPVALVPPEGGSDPDLWFHATRALRPGAGFEAQDVLASVSWGAAAILGIPDAERSPIGRPAEFVAFAGNPFETTAKPYIVAAEGRVARRPAAKRNVVAISAGRIHTCEGEALRDATILVEDGKVVSVGRRVAVPADARRIRAEVVVPGFVDASSQIGIRALSLQGEEVVNVLPPQPGGMDSPLARWFEPRFPTVRAAAASGVTAIALSPTGGRLMSGAMTTVKTHGSEVRVAKAVSGVHVDLGGLPAGPPLKRQLEAALEQGKKYFDAWEAYEKALAEWERGGKPAGPAPERKTIAAPAARRARDPVTGTWKGTATTPAFPRPIPFTLHLTLKGDSVTGRLMTPMAGSQEFEFSGSFQDGVISVEYEAGQIKATFRATVGRDLLTGTAVAVGFGEGTFEARRTEKPSDPDESSGDSRPAESRPSDGKTDDAKPAADGRPTEPKKDAALEPLRELFADRAAAYVVAPTERHAEIAIEVFRSKYELRTVISSPGSHQYMWDRYKSAGVAFASYGGSYRTASGELRNEAEASNRARIPTILRTGVGSDPRRLYGMAELAVRDGVDPDDALRMITRNPARFLGLLDRIGSLDRGKDADLLLLSGEPFEAGTRVLRTMIDGVFVDEETAP